MGERVIDRSAGAEESRYPITNVLDKAGDIVDKSFDRIPYCGPKRENPFSQLVKCHANSVDRIHDCSSNGVDDILDRADDVIKEAESAVEIDVAVAMDRDLYVDTERPFRPNEHAFAVDAQFSRSDVERFSEHDDSDRTVARETRIADGDADTPRNPPLTVAGR